MDNKKTVVERVTIGICIGVLAFFALTIMARFLTRQIFTKYLKVDNAFIELIWFDHTSAVALADDSEEQETSLEPDWQELYPFDESDDSAIVVSNASDTDTKDKTTGNFISQKLDRLNVIAAKIEDKVESYTTDWLAFRSKMVEYANEYEKIVCWNVVSYSEYNGIVRLSDGYLTSYVTEKDMTKQIEALSELNEFCNDNGAEFLYVQAPYKISEYDDTTVSGTLDFSNQNANKLLSGLKDRGISYYDIRQTIHENNLNNHSLFYKTDHHWLTTTGLWAAQNILSVCNKNYGWNADLSKLNSDEFDYKTYENWFLGTQGKKVTLAKCEPDDFVLLYPKYETSFHYIVPKKGIDTVSDYSVVYNMNQVDTCDYYNKSPYHACNYGDQPLVQIENMLEADDHKILIIHDSFGDCLISCLALAEKNVDSLDIRHFDGSVKTYIEESKPDLVIVMSSAARIGGDIDYTKHTNEFDFR